MGIFLGLSDAAYGLAADFFIKSFSKLNQIGADITNIMTGDGEAKTATVSNAIQTQVSTKAIPAVESFALALALLFFIISLVEISTQDRLTIEFFIKFFSKFIVAVFFILNAGKIFTGICSLGDGIANIFSGVTLSGGAIDELDKDAMIEAFKETDVHWLEALCSSVLTAGPIYLVSLVLIAICYIISFSRILELSARGSFLPIAFAMMSDDGWRGAGGRYVRKLLAVASQSAVLVLIAKFTTYAVGTLGQTLVSGVEMTVGGVCDCLIVLVGICIACVSLMFKSIGIVNDAFGG